MAVAQRHQDELPRLKESVKEFREYFQKNYDRYHYSRNFVFNTSLSQEDISILDEDGKPKLEFNTQEAFLSRMFGEFSKQEPSVSVTDGDDEKVDPAIIDAIGGHLRHEINTFNSKGGSYNSYKDSMSGGFSVWKMWDEYANSMSFNKVLRLDRAFDPTLCGFDPLARHPTKMDGRYAFEIFPKRKQEFIEENPKIDISQIRFLKSTEGFSWSYTTEKKSEVMLICDFYEKKSRKVKIVQLSNNKSLPANKYDEYVEQWKAAGHIAQPAMIIDTRMTDITYVCRYRFIEDQVIEYIETEFEDLPLIFLDGNSVELRQGKEGAMTQMTRPYTYHTFGLQRLQNFAGQSLGNELENTISHRLMAPLECIPEQPEYLEAYLKPQKPSTLLFNSFDEEGKPIMPPTVINRTPIPPEIMNTFMGTGQVMQAILGSYDASLGINNNQLSGTAMIEGATQSNAAAMPFIVSYLMALNQAARIYVNMIPKLYIKPREIPIVDIHGKKKAVKINQSGAIKFNYSSNSLNVEVSAGVNFAIQKSRSQQQMILGMQASPVFANFINTECLEEFVATFDIEGIDGMKAKAERFQQQLKMQQQQQMQMQQQQMKQEQSQPNPLVMRNQIDQAKLQQTTQQNQVENQLKAGQLSVDKQNADNDRLKILAQLQQDQQDNVIKVEKLQTEKTGQAVDIALKAADQHHSHTKDALEMHHNHTKDAIELHHKIVGSAQPEEATQTIGDNENG